MHTIIQICHFVKYDDLVTQPEQEIKKYISFMAVSLILITGLKT